MLTPKNIKAKTAIEYFKQGYYQKGKWHGIGALMLGLKGEIKNHQVYENIVQGLSPDGSKRLNKREVHCDKRKAAVDCTFAAPKSVSLCAFIGGDERLIQAHIRVVEKVLEEMEARYAQSRVMLDGKTQEVVKTGNMVIAKYDHIESRELDPHLHSHCLVMNMTQLPNGEWYSHLNDEIFKNQKLLGMMYQHYLAIEVQKLGYEIELLEHGQFDIKGYNQEDLIDFSKRRVQILALAGVDAGSVEREKAWSKTRRNKENVAPEELKARWQEEAAALGIEIVRPGAPKLEHQSVRVDEKIFADAIKYCSERQVAFRVEDIQAFILAESQPLDIATVEPLINSSDELIRIQEQNGIRYTTIAAVERELATINLMKAGQGKVSAIADLEIVEAHLEQTELNLGQRQAVMTALTTRDSFVAWQGVAGAGKTFALKEVLELAQSQGYSVKGFAPSSKASSVLGQELNTETQTVARLLASKPPNEIEHHLLWIVDEAGLLSAKDAYRLLQRATVEQARVILVGDAKQLSAVEAGNPFKSLQQAGIACAYLNQSQRQKDSPQLKVAIDLLAQGRVEAGFARLDAIGCIQKVAQKTKIEEIVKAYFNGTVEVQAKTLILAGTHKERIELTAALRGALQAQGRLGSDVLLTQLKSKDLRQIQLGYTSHFAVGDMVMPLRDYKRKSLSKGELYEVVGRTTDTIKVLAADGRQIEVDLNFKKAVFEREQIEIAVGDRLMWKKNNHPLQQVNGNEVKVVAINGNSVHVQEHCGKEHILNLNQPHHLDHAIVRTTYSSQGETADRVLIAADSTIGKESFYVAASRARMELRFFTSDKTKLMNWALRSRAQENPLEIIKNRVSKQISVEQLVGVGQSKTTPQTASLSPPPPIKHTTASPAPNPSQKSTRLPAAALAFPPQSPIPQPVKRSEPKHEQTQNQQITPPIPRLVPKPIPNEPFFSPTPAGKSPTHLEEKHWLELVEGSAIHPALASRNVRSLGMDSIEQEHEAWEYLMYSHKLERTNTGRLSSGILKHYRHIEDGGWWASAGIDARSLPLLQPGEKPLVKLWGCFKPDCPRVDADKSLKKDKTEYIKYEHPLKEERQLFLFDVPDALAQRIYDKYGIKPSEAEKQSGFWYITYKYNLPITLAEGAKKTLSSLSQGKITIGVSGVNGGYYANDSEHNRLPQRILHPELKVFATRGREFSFAFDQDTKQSTVWNVRRDMVRTGELLELEGCSVRVVQWQGDKGKGLDDLIHNSGPLAYALAQSNSIPLALDAQKHYRGEYSRLAKKVKDSLPTLSEEAIDVEIYKLALFKGDIRDGARTIAQSNQARSFKATMSTEEATEKTFSYIEQIEKLISQPAGQLKSEQQPVHQSNSSQSNEVNYDTQSLRAELTVAADTSNELNRLDDRKFDATTSKQHKVNGEDRFTREQSKAIEGDSDLSANQPEPNPQRVDAQMGKLLAATNQYAERHEAESVGASLERFYHSLTERRLSSRGAEELTSANGQQDAAIFDSTRTNARTTPQITKQCLNAIAQYIQQETIEATIVEKLPALSEQLNQLTQKSTQTEQLDEALQTQAIKAIAQHIEQQSIESVLVENLPAFTRQLKQLTGQEFEQTTQLNESLQAQAVDAIAKYVEQQSIETAIIETLPALTHQLNQLTHKPTQIASSGESLPKQAVDAIAQYIEQQSIESALIGTLPALRQKLNQLTQNSQREQPYEFLQQQAIDAITEYIEQQSIEATLIETLPALTQKLNQLIKQEIGQTDQLDESLPKQAIDAITKYIEKQSIEAELVQAVESLTQIWQQLLPSRPSSLIEQPDKRVVIEQQRHQQEENLALDSSKINSSFQYPNLTRQQKSTKLHQLTREIKTADPLPKTPLEVENSIGRRGRLPQLDKSKLDGEPLIVPLSLQQEALETVQAVKTMLRHIGKIHPGGFVFFEGNRLLFAQQGNAVTITAKSGSREILRVEGDRVVAFNPTADEGNRLKSFRKDVAINFQQQQQQQERRRGRSV